MKRSPIVAVLALAFLLLAAMKTDEATPLGANVQIGPSTRDPYQLLRRTTPDTYTCRALVYDANDRSYVFASLDVVVAPGEKESKSVTAQDLTTTFTVGVSKNSDRAIAQVTSKRGGKIVFNQRSEIELRRPERTIIPLQ
jgi:hypothetical protein